MNAGYGVNTFVLVNSEGKETYVKVRLFASHTCCAHLAGSPSLHCCQAGLSLPIYYLTQLILHLHM